MNNEEKILNVLEQVVERLDQVDARLDNVDGRLDKMDNRMDTMQKQLDAVQETATRVAITQENVVLPRIQLLAEGQTTILDKMPTKSRIEALEEDVSTLKAIVKFHAADIAELKAAK